MRVALAALAATEHACAWPPGHLVEEQGVDLVELRAQQLGAVVVHR